MSGGNAHASDTMVDLRPWGAQPWRHPTSPPRRPTRVLIASSDADERRRLVAQLQGEVGVASASTAAEVGNALRAAEIDVLVVGSALADVAPARLIRAVSERGLCAVVSAGDAPAADGVFYRLHRHASDEDVRAIVRGALASRRPAGGRDEDASDREARLRRASYLQRLGEQARAIALQRTPRDAARVAAAAVSSLVDVDRVSFLYYDGESGTLWSEAGDPADDYAGPASSGLAGFAARTGSGFAVPRADADPRYDEVVDSRGGDGADRLAMQPVVTDDGDVHAVIVAARGRRAAPFDHHEREILRAFAQRCAPVLDGFALQAEAAEVRAEVAAEATPSMYRPQALEAYARRKAHGEVVRVAAGWTRLVYWILSAFIVLAAAYAWFARVGEYANGAAVVVTRDRVEITARLPGTLTRVDVRPGEPVRKGQILASFYDAAESAELASLDERFERALVQRLREPADRAVEQSQVDIAGRRGRARARLEERTLRAPVDGVVSDLRARQGQLVAAGSPVLAIVQPGARADVVVAVPAGHRPLLRPGMTVRLTLAGHPGDYIEVPITSITDDAMTARDVARARGDELAGMLPQAGTFVLVEAALPSVTVELGGRDVDVRHGMQAAAEIRLRSERVITALIPGLRDVVGGSDE